MYGFMTKLHKYINGEIFAYHIVNLCNLKKELWVDII